MVHDTMHNHSNTGNSQDLTPQDVVTADALMEITGCTTTLAALAALRTGEYGYSLRRKLSAAGLDVGAGALYPLLRRLESQGLLEAEWRETPAGSQRYYYRLAAAGHALLQELRRDWQAMAGALNTLLETTE